MRYFLKELVAHNPIGSSSGTPFNWEMVGDDTGVLATEDPTLIADLEAFAKSRRGVVERTQEQYEALKKNPQYRKRPGQTIESQTYKLVNTSPSLRDVQPAKAPESASPAAVASPAVAAAAPAPSVVVKAPIVLNTTKSKSGTAAKKTPPVAASAAG